jgi:hypothetical protein
MKEKQGFIGPKRLDLFISSFKNGQFLKYETKIAFFTTMVEISKGIIKKKAKNGQTILENSFKKDKQQVKGLKSRMTNFTGLCAKRMSWLIA